MKKNFSLGVAFFMVFVGGLVFGSGFLVSTPKEFPVRGFSFDQEIEVPLTPEKAFDTFTGDISPWWDHRFSKKPTKFVIEPKPGGHFIEQFDEQGNGVIHGLVTWSDRGKKLVFRGPLGLHGKALDLVCGFQFEPSAEGCKIKASIHGMGETNAETEKIIAQVWDHFLVERFQKYAQGLGSKKN